MPISLIVSLFLQYDENQYTSNVSFESMASGLKYKSEVAITQSNDDLWYRLNKSIAAIFFVFILLAASSCSLQSSQYTKSLPELVLPHTNVGVFGGTVIMVPGLNVCPQGMTELASVFNQQGFDVWIIPLIGQSNDCDDCVDPTIDIWIKQITDAYENVRSEARNREIIAVGYSLGAALIVDLLNTSPEIKFDKVVLLAPAVELTCSTTLARLLLPLRFLGLSLPSMSPERLRCRAWTSLQSYSALFNAVDSAEQVSDQSTLRTAPLLIAMSRDDELVSFRGVENWIVTNNLMQSEFMTLSPDPTSDDNYDHSIIDQPGLGVDEWRKFTDRVEAFLRK